MVPDLCLCVRVCMQPGTFLDNSESSLNYTDFVNKELILFSLADNMRSIPSVMDGFKPGQRKIIFSCFKRRLKSDVKVSHIIHISPTPAQYVAPNAPPITCLPLYHSLNADFTILFMLTEKLDTWSVCYGDRWHSWRGTFRNTLPTTTGRRLS